MNEFWEDPAKIFERVYKELNPEISLAEEHWTRALKANQGYLANETDPQLLEKFSHNAMRAYAQLLIAQVSK